MTGKICDVFWLIGVGDLEREEWQDVKAWTTADGVLLASVDRFPVGTTRDRSGLGPGQAHPMHGGPLNMASVIWLLSALMADAYNELPRKLAELRSKPITPLP